MVENLFKMNFNLQFKFSNFNLKKITWIDGHFHGFMISYFYATNTHLFQSSGYASCRLYVIPQQMPIICYKIRKWKFWWWDAMTTRYLTIRQEMLSCNLLNVILHEQTIILSSNLPDIITKLEPVCSQSRGLSNNANLDSQALVLQRLYYLTMLFIF